MKLAFLLLVLVNLLLFAWQQGAFGRYGEPGREPERVARQIEPERFRVLTEPDVRALRERATQGSATQGSANQGSANQGGANQGGATQGSGAPLDLSAAQACLEFGDFSPADSGRVEKALAALSPALRVEARAIDAPGWYMVYLPPHRTWAEAERRADELRRLGVTDLIVMNESAPLKFAISLGSFRDPAAAKAHLAALEKMGVKGVRVSERSSGGSLVRFQLRDIDATAARQLSALRSGYPSQTLKACTPG